MKSMNTKIVRRQSVCNSTAQHAELQEAVPVGRQTLDQNALKMSGQSISAGSKPPLLRDLR